MESETPTIRERKKKISSAATFEKSEQILAAAEQEAAHLFEISFYENNTTDL